MLRSPLSTTLALFHTLDVGRRSKIGQPMLTKDNFSIEQNTEAERGVLLFKHCLNIFVVLKL